MRKKNPKDFLKIIGSAIYSAQKSYESMTGWSLDDAPEYFISCKIAEALIQKLKPQNHYVALEVPVKEIREGSKAKKWGRPAGVERRGGRIDVVLYGPDHEESPYAIVEVKRRITLDSPSQIKPDIQRICTTLNANPSKNSIQFGAFSFFSFHYGDTKNNNSPEESLKKLLKKIEDRIKIIAEEYGCITHTSQPKIDGSYDGKRKFSWAGTCVVITRGKKY